MTINLESYQKTNLIIWISILTCVIFLTVIVLVLDKLQVFYESYNLSVMSEILFIVAIALAFAILILKRSVFRLDKIMQRSSTLTQSAERENYILVQIRRNYIILWMLAEVIGMIGFIFYLFTSDLQNYLLFAVVSIFSMVTNFPRNETIRICLENLNQPGPAA